MICVFLFVQKVKRWSKEDHEWRQLEVVWCDIIENAVEYRPSSSETTYNQIIGVRL
jgi:hypothetical protein